VLQSVSSSTITFYNISVVNSIITTAVTYFFGTMNATSISTYNISLTGYYAAVNNAGVSSNIQFHDLSMT